MADELEAVLKEIADKGLLGPEYIEALREVGASPAVLRDAVNMYAYAPNALRSIASIALDTKSKLMKKAAIPAEEVKSVSGMTATPATTSATDFKAKSLEEADKIAKTAPRTPKSSSAPVLTFSPGTRYVVRVSRIVKGKFPTPQVFVSEWHRVAEVDGKTTILEKTTGESRLPPSAVARALAQVEATKGAFTLTEGKRYYVFLRDVIATPQGAFKDFVWVALDESQ